MAIVSLQREIVESSISRYPNLGYFEGIIKYADLQVGKSGSKTINLSLKSKNENEWDITIYNAIRLTNNDGSENFQVSSLLVPMLLTMGLDSFDDEYLEEKVVKTGKDQNERVLRVFPQLTEKPVALWLIKEYRLWNNELKEYFQVKTFFRIADKATGKEIQTNLNLGSTYNELVRLDEKELYRDGLTKDLVLRMKGGNAFTNTPTPPVDDFNANELFK